MPKKSDKKLFREELEDGVNSSEEFDESGLDGVAELTEGGRQALSNCVSVAKSEGSFENAAQNLVVPESSNSLDETKDEASDWNARPQIESVLAYRPSTRLESAIRKMDKRKMGKLRKLIQNGADVNEIGHSGITPLMVAIVTGQFAVVKFLVENGADPNILSDDGYSALVMAIDNEMKDVVRYLLDHGAKVDLTNRDNETPLMEALQCASPSEKIISMLIDAGASVLHKSDMRESPISLVKKNGDPQLIRFFSEKTHYLILSDIDSERLIRKEMRNRIRTRFKN